MVFLVQPIHAEYIARITAVNTDHFPVVRVYVSITDASGYPIPNDQEISLMISEDGKLISNQKLIATHSEQQPVWSVLVLDRSGSMQGEKLQRAIKATKTYVDLAPPGYQIAVVSFADTPSIISDFSGDKETLRSRIGGLSAKGQTALQDAIGTALDMLKWKNDRRAVIALTDGVENKSRNYKGTDGQKRLLRQSIQEGTTVSIIGLGDNVHTKYLEKYMATGGWYFFTPTTGELKSAFKKTAFLLKKEFVVEYKSPQLTRDGTRGRLRVALFDQDNFGYSVEMRYVRPGVLPHVRGNHVPYFMVLLLLLSTPKFLHVIKALVAIYRFRSSSVKQLGPGSVYLGQRDLNIHSKGEGFQIGDYIIVCPVCNKPHNSRSWRLNRCRCMHEHLGKGNFCYHRTLPRWIRNLLDFLYRRRYNAMGRLWLCRCEGDKDGY